jgi:hypothetical protein
VKDWEHTKRKKRKLSKIALMASSAAAFVSRDGTVHAAIPSYGHMSRVLSRAPAPALVSAAPPHLTCPICRSLLDRPVVLPCGHTVCRDCAFPGRPVRITYHHPAHLQIETLHDQTILLDFFYY